MQFHSSFNTGRGYAPEGQIITTRQDIGEQGEQLVVLFHDHTRSIWGQIDSVYDADETLESFVMRHYDAGNYSWHPEAGSLEEQEH